MAIIPGTFFALCTLYHRERGVHQVLWEKMAHLVEKEYLDCEVPQE